MKIIRISILVLLLVAGALIAVGTPGSAENGSASEVAAPEPQESSSAGSPGTEEAPEEEDAPPLETFVPTERLPADSAISFPVDI